MKKLSKAKAEKAFNLIKKLGGAYLGDNPKLIPNFEGIWYRQDPNWAVMDEEGEYEWSLYVMGNKDLNAELKKLGIGVWAEAYNGWIISLYADN